MINQGILAERFREVFSALAAVICFALVAETQNLIVLGGVVSTWALRYVLERKSSVLTAGWVVGALGVFHALAGGHAEHGHSFQIAYAGVQFVNAHLNPVSLFAALQLVILNRTIRTASTVNWLPKSPVNLFIIFSTITVAILFGLLTHGVRLDQLKIGAWGTLQVTSISLFVAMMIMHALVVATVEESLFRGVIQNGLREIIGRRTGPKTAIWSALFISNVFFGLVHFKLGIYWMLGAAIAGIGYGVAYEVSGGKLIAAVATHATIVMLITGALKNV
jgi:membrane protease YdiL (CAAX protease family)